MGVDVVLLGGILSDTPMRYMGPYAVRHALVNRGYQTQVIDFCHFFAEDDLLDLLLKFVGPETSVLGLSSTFWNSGRIAGSTSHWTNNGYVPPNIQFAVSRVRECYPHLKVVLGGSKVYGMRRTPLIDYYVVGLGEDLVPDLVDYIVRDTAAPTMYKDAATGKTYVTDSLTKSFDIVNHAFRWTTEDCISPQEALPLETARGCIFKCKFCSYPGLGKTKFDYLRRNDLIVEELTDNYSRFGTQFYNMLDDTFNDSEYKIREWHTAVKSLPFDIGYTAYLRADLLDVFTGQPEFLQDSGLVSAFLGIETLHPRASLVIGKGWSGTKARQYVPHLVNRVWDRQINVTLGMIVGLPHETRSSVYNSWVWTQEHALQASFQGLNISKTDQKTYRSEFDKNYAEYGFSFDEHGRWLHKDWTYESAHTLAADLSRLSDRRRLINNWAHTTARAMGWTQEQLMTMTYDKVFKVLQADPTEQFIAQYKERLLAL